MQEMYDYIAARTKKNSKELSFISYYVRDKELTQKKIKLATQFKFQVGVAPSVRKIRELIRSFKEKSESLERQNKFSFSLTESKLCKVFLQLDAIAAQTESNMPQTPRI